MLNSDDLDLMLDDEDSKPGGMFRWYFRSTDETGHDYLLGHLTAPTLQEANKLALLNWPDCKPYLNWAQRIETLEGEDDDAAPCEE